jgi:predicted ATP-dependent serine protease
MKRLNFNGDNMTTQQNEVPAHCKRCGQRTATTNGKCRECGDPKQEMAATQQLEEEEEAATSRTRQPKKRTIKAKKRSRR